MTDSASSNQRKVRKAKPDPNLTAKRMLDQVIQRTEKGELARPKRRKSA